MTLLPANFRRLVRQSGVDIDAVHKKARRRNKQPEADMQKRLIAFLDSYPIGRGGEMLGEYVFHVPRGNLSKAQAGVLKAMGARKGMLDLICVLGVYQKSQRSLSPGAVLELKADKEKPTPEQYEWLALFDSQGWQVGWTDNYDVAVAFFKAYIHGALLRPTDPRQKLQLAFNEGVP